MGVILSSLILELFDIIPPKLLLDYSHRENRRKK